MAASGPAGTRNAINVRIAMTRQEIADYLALRSKPTLLAHSLLDRSVG
jgi:Bacterial regulatory proteins, crp family